LTTDVNNKYSPCHKQFPIKTSTASLVFRATTNFFPGWRIMARQPLQVASLMPERGVIFSDGIDKDFLRLNSGTQAEINEAARTGLLVV